MKMIPIVKIFDLRIAEKLSELKLRVNVQGYPPFKEKIANNVYTLDYKKLGYAEEPFVVSPFTNRNLSFVINGNAEIFVDYRIDLYEALKKQMRNNIKKGKIFEIFCWKILYLYLFIHYLILLTKIQMSLSF